jgi:hypothetical protein
MPYVRRFRMELDLADSRPAAPTLPAGYHWLPWHASLLHRHAEVKYHSFHDEIDSQVFPCLGEIVGCRRLMKEIARHEGFLAQTTWLITQHADARNLDVRTRCSIAAPSRDWAAPAESALCRMSAYTPNIAGWGWDGRSSSRRSKASAPPA